MWLHIPASFPCAVDTADSTSPSDECFQGLAQSATLSGKFHACAYWQRAWQKGRLTRLRFGMMLPPSILNRGLEQWISSLQDSPANPIRLQMDISRADRLRMLGNGVVPPQAAVALHALLTDVFNVKGNEHEHDKDCMD